MGLVISDYSKAVLYPTDSAQPEECNCEVYSDISGRRIPEEDIWAIKEGNNWCICTEDEMLEDFYQNYVCDVGEKEYDRAKRTLIEENGYSEEDFVNHPALIKVDCSYSDEDPYEYFFKDGFDPISEDCLPNCYRKMDIDDLSVDEPEEDDYPYDY